MSERLRQLRALLSEEPADAFLRYAIALELKRLGRPGEALADLESLVTDEPGHIATYYQLALLLAEAGRAEEAMQACEAGALRCVLVGDRKARSELLSLKQSLQELE
ncbi:MAG: tetratricopeptide repeat protein [Flavobacteriales bacterium]|nr:tetratricopeptide repeat protein [Flavobacteriales bacterium]